MSGNVVSGRATPLCRGTKADGSPCQRKVTPGQERCYQHVSGLMAKWRALTRSQSLLLVLAIIGALGIPLTVVVWKYPRAWESKTPTIPPALPPTEVYIDCHMMSLPLHVAPGLTAHVIPLNRRQYANMKWGFYGITNSGNNKELLWPKQYKLKAFKFNPGESGYTCDVTNHGSVNIIEAAIPLRVNYQEKETLIYTATVGPLDAGGRFSFSILNECPIVTTVILPEKVNVHVFGEATGREVDLHWPRTSPVDQIMMFAPSKVTWTDNECESLPKS